MSKSIFSRIVAGEIPCYKIAEDESHLAFLDIRPVAKGHTLVIPKREVDYIFDLPDEELAALHVFSKKVATAIQKAIPCVRIGTTVLGLEVPHAHIHLVPLQSDGFIKFSKAKELSSEVMSEVRDAILAQF